MTGRKPQGPQLVQHLDGSDRAKERLEVILETVAGNMPIRQACERLGIKEAMFHRLRKRVLQAGLEDLEPRLRGRPRHELSDAERQSEQLTDEVEQLKSELEIAEIRRELAAVLPHLEQQEAGSQDASKKTNPQQWRKRRRRLASKKLRRPKR